MQLALGVLERRKDPEWSAFLGACLSFVAVAAGAEREPKRHIEKHRCNMMYTIQQYVTCDTYVCIYIYIYIMIYYIYMHIH